jgi:lysyl-tRNA synthetase class 2
MLMANSEEMMSGLVKHITGSYKTVYHTKPEGDPARQEYHIDWSTPWKRYPMIPTLEGIVATAHYRLILTRE